MKIDVTTEILAIKQKTKAIEQKLGCEFIRIDPDKEEIDIFEVIIKVFRYIKQSSNQLTKQSAKKALVQCNFNDVQKLELKSDYNIKYKVKKHIVKKITRL